MTEGGGPSLSAATGSPAQKVLGLRQGWGAEGPACQGTSPFLLEAAGQFCQSSRGSRDVRTWFQRMNRS